LRSALIDKGEMMAGAAVVDILTEPPNLTDFQFEKICNALNQFGEWTEKVILRQTLFRKLKKEVFTKELFSECFIKGDGSVHNVLIDLADKNQMELIAEKGANKAVRNIAKQN
jgi:hypothetical protein